MSDQTARPSTVAVLLVLSDVDAWLTAAEIATEAEHRTGHRIHTDTVRHALDKCTADNLDRRFTGYGEPATEWRLNTEAFD